MNQSLLSEITQDVFDNVPNYDERKAMLARDPLASCEGFHTLVRLVLRHLFGVRFCQNCPQCAKSTASPCTDAFGSNAMACGGILGRVDAAYGAVEFQKAGSAHVHFQLFVQCIHQHTPLSQMAKRYESVLQEILRRAGKYNAHVRRTVYCDPAEWDERRREVVEQAWPEYRDEVLMLSRPAYQADESLSGDEWKEQFFVKDVELLQQYKQHHVHIPQEPGGPRLPLAHCKDPHNPCVCKAGARAKITPRTTSAEVCSLLSPHLHMSFGYTSNRISARQAANRELAAHLPRLGRGHADACVWQAQHAGKLVGSG